MKHYIVKNNKIIDTCLWDGVTPWVYPFAHDVVLSEKHPDVSSYPFASTETIQGENILQKIPGVITVVEDYIRNKENITKEELDDLISSTINSSVSLDSKTVQKITKEVI